MSSLLVTVFVCRTLSQDMHPFLLLFLHGEHLYMGGSFALTRPVMINSFRFLDFLKTIWTLSWVIGFLLILTKRCKCCNAIVFMSGFEGLKLIIYLILGSSSFVLGVSNFSLVASCILSTARFRMYSGYLLSVSVLDDHSCLRDKMGFFSANSFASH